MTSLPKQTIDQNAGFAAWLPTCCAELGLVTRFCFGITLLVFFSAKVQAQSGGSGITYAPSGSPVDIPQTNLVPIAPRTSGVSPYGSPQPYGNSSLNTIAPTLGPPTLGPQTLGPPTLGPPTLGPPTLGAPTPGIPGSTASGTMFDPYSTGQAPGYYPPAMPGAIAPMSSGIPGAPPPIYGTPPPTYGAPAPLYGMQPVPSTYAVPGSFGSTAFPPTIYPSGTPSTLFPNGLYGTAFLDSASNFNAYQFLRGPRFRYTFLSSDSSPESLGINNFDTSIAVSFPNFCYSSQPLFVVPSFSLHLWDGPDGSTGADLPPNAYSAFLDFGWQSDPNQMFGAEFGVRVGAFTDFNTFESDSIRVMGKGLASFRLTPTSTMKLGVYYLDRNSVKLLPAFGVLCQANPNTRLDFFFPQPKFAHYCRTVGTQDLWWYLAGDYGGGTWTIKRDDGTTDSVDINDIQVMVGWEWGRSELIRAGRRTAFLEFGYVFDRQLKYRISPQDDISNNDSFMFRVGYGY